jgi:hypothetical protein
VSAACVVVSAGCVTVSAGCAAAPSGTASLSGRLAARRARNPGRSHPDGLLDVPSLRTRVTSRRSWLSVPCPTSGTGSRSRGSRRSEISTAISTALCRWGVDGVIGLPGPFRWWCSMSGGALAGAVTVVRCSSPLRTGVHCCGHGDASVCGGLSFGLVPAIGTDPVCGFAGRASPASVAVSGEVLV